MYVKRHQNSPSAISGSTEFYEVTISLFCAKKTKITTLFNLSPPCHRNAILESTTIYQRVNKRRKRIRVARLTQNSVRCLRLCRGDKLLNKAVILVFFVHKKYSHNFITLRLNH